MFCKTVVLRRTNDPGIFAAVQAKPPCTEPLRSNREVPALAGGHGQLISEPFLFLGALGVDHNGLLRGRDNVHCRGTYRLLIRKYFPGGTSAMSKEYTLRLFPAGAVKNVSLSSFALFRLPDATSPGEHQAAEGP